MTDITASGDTVRTLSYAERIEAGRRSHEALRRFDVAMASGDAAGMEAARGAIKADYPSFGFGYLDSPSEAAPPRLHSRSMPSIVMVILGGWLLLFFAAAPLLGLPQAGAPPGGRVVQWLGMITIPLVWVCSQSGWIVAEGIEMSKRNGSSSLSTVLAGLRCRKR